MCTGPPGENQMTQAWLALDLTEKMGQDPPWMEKRAEGRNIPRWSEFGSRMEKLEKFSKGGSGVVIEELQC